MLTLNLEPNGEKNQTGNSNEEEGIKLFNNLMMADGEGQKPTAEEYLATVKEKNPEEYNFLQSRLEKDPEYVRKNLSAIYSSVDQMKRFREQRKEKYGNSTKMPVAILMNGQVVHYSEATQETKLNDPRGQVFIGYGIVRDAETMEESFARKSAHNL